MEVNEVIGVTLSPQHLFAWASQAALLGWVILVFLPRRIKPLFFIPQYLIPFGLALLYAGLMLTYFFASDGGYGSIKAVRTLFENDYVLLAGWIHYLAFDLFIGAWIARQADQIGMTRLIQAVILLATFMFGPLGLVLFLSMRAGFSRTVFSKQGSKADA